MSMNLPPQAYTRDMLAAAFEWLHTQPASVRELATNSDSLVSLYLRSKRRPSNAGQNLNSSSGQKDATEFLSPPNPNSSESFKQDLRTIAEGLKQFDHNKPTPPQTPFVAPDPIKTSLPPTFELDRTVYQHAPTSSNSIAAKNNIESASLPPSNALAKPPELRSLDPRTRDLIKKTQMLLNLSSEEEALRLLVVSGFEHIKEIFPKL